MRHDAGGLAEVMGAISNSIEHLSPDLRCAIWLLEDGQPSKTAGSEEAFTDRPQAVDACFRTCGPVLSLDSGPCWAWPILDSRSEALGVLAVRPPEPRSPRPKEREGLERAAHAMAIRLEQAAWRLPA